LIWNKTIWKIANPTITSPWAENSVTKREVFWRFFERYHMKIYLEWLANTMHRNL
jgi:hypothetical protein